MFQKSCKSCNVKIRHKPIIERVIKGTLGSITGFFSGALIGTLAAPGPGTFFGALGGAGAETFGVRAGGVNKVTFVIFLVFILSAMALHWTSEGANEGSALEFVETPGVLQEAQEE